MSRLSVGPDGREFLRDGDEHVPLLDTAWNAFAEIDDTEWGGYLRLRREQGFTGILVSLLPTLHDRSENAGSRMPFRRGADGSLDPSMPEERYFERARTMMQTAIGSGFEVFLVVLWSSYIAGSPANRLAPGVTLGTESRRALVDRVLRQFRDLAPVLVISGDDPFEDEESLQVYREIGARFFERSTRIASHFSRLAGRGSPRRTHPAL